MNSATERVRHQLRRVAQTPRTFRNWPTLLGQMAAEKVGRGPATLEFETRGGVRLVTANVPGARLPMYEQFADDCYELEWIIGSEPTLSVLDIGSHVGAFAANLASAAPQVRVECYEPSPASAHYLRENVARNGLVDRVFVHEVAIAGEVGSALLDDNRSGSVHNGLVRDEHRLVTGDDAWGNRGVLSVAATTFDRVASDAAEPFAVVKMDCEGGEYELVYASSPDSWASVQRAVIEYHPVPGQAWDSLRDWLEGVGLRVVRHEPAAPALGTAWLARGTG